MATSPLSSPQVAPPLTDPTIERLEDQIGWYDRKSRSSQHWYKWVKGVQVAAAALTTFSAAVGWPRYLTAGLGVIILVLQGLEQLNQYHANWINYRATCEMLRHEKYLYLGQAGPYAGSPNAHALLAQRVEALVSREHMKWASVQEESRRSDHPGE